MRKNRIIYIIILVGCLIFSMAYKSRISAVLLATTAAYPLAALLLTALSLLFVKAEFTEKYKECEKNRKFDIGIWAVNRSVLPFVPVEISCVLPDAASGKMSGKRVYASLCPFGRSRLVITCMHAFRGSYTCSIDRVAVCDPLRLIRLSRRLDVKMNVVFLPRRISLGEIADTSDAENDTSSNPMRGEKDEFSHVRSYIEGDILQLIHWKLTAKTDELMIKQFDEINDRHALILCDYNFPENADAVARADGIIETAVAFALSTGRSGVKTRVRFGAADADMYGDIDTPADFERFYRTMAVIPAKMGVCAFSELIRSCNLNDVTVLFLVTSELAEETISYADSAAERFGMPVILAYVNFSGKKPENVSGRFMLMNIRAGDPDGIINAAAELEMP